MGVYLDQLLASHAIATTLKTNTQSGLSPLCYCCYPVYVLQSDGTTYTGEWEMGLRHGRGAMRYADGTVFDGLWWKDRRLKPGEDGPSTERERLVYEKPYDHYFCEPDELWEQK